MRRTLLREQGFTLTELMIVVAVIGILSTIAIPNFLGMQKKARARAVIEACSSSKSELQNWMITVASRESGTADFEGDGDLDVADDLARPANLAAIPGAWDALHSVGAPRESESPYFSGLDLFNTASVPGDGQISITCNVQTCNIRGYSNHPADGAIYTAMVGAVE